MRLANRIRKKGAFALALAIEAGAAQVLPHTRAPCLQKTACLVGPPQDPMHIPTVES